ncbi:DUF4133 domain-containing protein [Echinicola rosea]|uniref:DUF4133 domain-containing protein n=1 Tax=Echinicola rosea TaxID=1807691 RepID=A0ABQ1V7J4_9BACT|nr:DUF4133 domain-containing protein [Echinicola rosea]GGF42631.1 hypothetical protein GCM10011339_33870 [Echinicola rosea]
MKRFTLNKGVNRPISFKGLQAQYILYLGIGLVVLLLLFAMGYVLGISFWINGTACGFMGYLLIEGVFGLNRKYGEHGLKKRMAFRKVPMGIKVRDREFIRKQDRKKHG